MSNVCVYVPLVVPDGKPVNVGTDVATPVVPGAATQQWMWAAVFGVVSPAKTTFTVIRFVVVSQVTLAVPEHAAGPGSLPGVPWRRRFVAGGVNVGAAVCRGAPARRWTAPFVAGHPGGAGGPACTAVAATSSATAATAPTATRVDLRIV